MSLNLQILKDLQARFVELQIIKDLREFFGETRMWTLAARFPAANRYEESVEPDTT